MNAVALEARKVDLAREILSMDDEVILHDMWLFLQRQRNSAKRQADVTKPKKGSVSIEDAYGIFKDLQGMDTTIERDGEDRV